VTRSELVLTATEGAVGVVLLNRPEQLNALSTALMECLSEALAGLDADETIRAIVIGGSEQVFAAGADIGELLDATPVDLYLDRRIEHWDRIRAVTKPIVAAVSGHCLGGGCELAMTCDLIVASETASFGQPESALGLIPGAGGTQRLTRAVGKAVAMDVVLSGRRLTAAEALAAGLVSRVVAAEAWLDEAKRVAAAIAAKGPLATRIAKQEINRSFELSLDGGLAHERLAFYLAAGSSDAREGLSAFADKRPPAFSGR
jgi:enoyl-CoA hydratase